jgi:hypothetical protein
LLASTAVAGPGSKDEKSSAIFRVLLDGKGKYSHGSMRLGGPVQPVVVGIASDELLRLKKGS